MKENENNFIKFAVPRLRPIQDLPKSFHRKQSLSREEVYILLYMIQYKYHEVFFSFFHDLVVTANINSPTTNEPFAQVKEHNECRQHISNVEWAAKILH